MLSGEPAALATAFLWTISSLAFEHASRRIGSLSVNLIRLALALLFLFILHWITAGNPFPAASPAAWCWLSLSGFLGFFLCDLLLFESFARIGSRLTMLAFTSVPVVTVLLGWLLLGEIPKATALAGIAVTLCGIAITVLFGMTGTASSANHRSGILLACGASLCSACGLIAGKKGIGGMSAFLATQIRILPALAAFLILFLAGRLWPRLHAAFRDRQALLVVTLGAVAGPFLGVAFSLAAIRSANTAVAATLMGLVPVLIILPSAILFREKTGWPDILGAFIAVGGTILLFI